MRSSFRGALLLGSAIVLVTAPSAFADDPLVPEGAERPKMGKELVLPPMLNEAPPGTVIVLPPPGQEHLLGKRPDGTFVSAEKSTARADEEPVTRQDNPDAASQVATASSDIPQKTRKSKVRARAAQGADVTLAANADEAHDAGLKKTNVPDQSLVVAEDPADRGVTIAEAGIVQTGARMTDLAKPNMGGPELSGPPKPTDGMIDAPAPIRDGDTLSPAEEQKLARVEPKADAAAKAPAIERFEIAAATAAPTPVTPGKAMNSASSDWDVEISGTIGYGHVDTATQSYFGFLDNSFSSGSNPKSLVSGGDSLNGLGPINAFQSDNEDEVLTYEAAAKINLTGDVEPLGGGSNVTPYVKVAVSGYQAKFSNGVSSIDKPGNSVFVPGVEGFGGEGWDGGEGGEGDPNYGRTKNGGHSYYNGNYAFDRVEDVRYNGKENVIRALLEYGQTWKGSSGLDVTGFAQIAHTRRNYEHSLTFVGQGLCTIEWDGWWYKDCYLPEIDSIAQDAIAFGEVAGYNGRYDTDLDSDTTSFGLGAGIEFPLSKDRKLKADAHVRGSYDITTVDGSDSLRIVNNDNGGVVGSSVTQIKATHDSFGYGGGAGISYEVAQGIQLRLGAEYSSQEAAPVVIRDGVNASRVEFDREDVLTGTLTATFKF